MKIMNNRAMSQFGGEAFNIKLDSDIAAPPRLNANKLQHIRTEVSPDG